MSPWDRPLTLVTSPWAPPLTPAWAATRAPAWDTVDPVQAITAWEVPAQVTLGVAAGPAAVTVRAEDDKVGDEDVDPVSHGGQPQHEGIPPLPGPELPQLEEDLVVIHEHEVSPELSDRDGQLFA